MGNLVNLGAVFGPIKKKKKGKGPIKRSRKKGHCVGGGAAGSGGRKGFLGKVDCFGNKKTLRRVPKGFWAAYGFVYR